MISQIIILFMEILRTKKIYFKDTSFNIHREYISKINLLHE